jgi:hypothetical protein
MKRLRFDERWFHKEINPVYVSGKASELPGFAGGGIEKKKNKKNKIYKFSLTLLKSKGNRFPDCT